MGQNKAKIYKLKS